MSVNEIGTIIIDTAIKLHKKLGPRLYESVYETILTRLLQKRGLKVERQVPIAICLEVEIFEEAFRADMNVEGKVIIELKPIDKLV